MASRGFVTSAQLLDIIGNDEVIKTFNTATDARSGF